MDESRKQFHDYMLERPGAVCDDIARRLKDGEYVHIATQLRWEAWQASRSAIEIKAPRFISSREALTKGYTVDYSNGFGDGMDAYEENILAAGIKVKE